MLVAACGVAAAGGIPGRLHAAAGEAPAIPANLAPAAVAIDNFTFSPAVLTVAPGTTVTWTNRDDIPHLVVGKGKPFRSKALDTDGQYSFTFETPGEYDYFCALHPHMVGKVVVTAADPGSAQH